MGKVRIVDEPMEGLLVLESAVVADSRGSFEETWNEADMAEIGVRARFVQDNQSVSRRGVLRGEDPVLSEKDRLYKPFGITAGRLRDGR